MNVHDPRINIAGIFLVFVIIGIMTMPSASAMDTPNFDTIPVTVPQGGALTLKYSGDIAKDPHTVLLTRMIQAGVTPNGGLTDSATSPGAASNCALKIRQVLAVDGDQWELRHNVGGGQPVIITGLDVGESVSIPFVAGAVAITRVGTVGVSSLDAAQTAVWFDIRPGGGSAANTNVVGQMSWESCGTDTGVGVLLDWEHKEQIQVVVPVGGEILPINTTSLLIAGFSSNPFWILTMLAITAGAAFTLLRFQLLRK